MESGELKIWEAFLEEVPVKDKLSGGSSSRWGQEELGQGGMTRPGTSGIPLGPKHKSQQAKSLREAGPWQGLSCRRNNPSGLSHHSAPCHDALTGDPGTWC